MMLIMRAITNPATTPAIASVFPPAEFAGLVLLGDGEGEDGGANVLTTINGISSVAVAMKTNT